jgi:histidinol-phosphate aminotransferase
MSLFRNNVEAMTPYVPGEQPAPGERVVKRNTNENPYPPSSKVAEAIQAELEANGSGSGSGDPVALEFRKAASESRISAR